MVYQFLSHLAGIRVKLKKIAPDIVEAQEMITKISQMYRCERKDINYGFTMVYTQSMRMAERVGTTASVPCTVSPQGNYTVVTLKPATLVSTSKIEAIPFLDHIIMCIFQQFSTSAIIASSQLGLVPSILGTKTVKLETAIVLCMSDLPSTELIQWELNANANANATTAETCISSSSNQGLWLWYFPLHQYCSTSYMYTSYNILWMRMKCKHLMPTKQLYACIDGKSHLSLLDLLHICYDAEVDLDEVVDC